MADEQPIKKITIPTPAEIEAELEQMAERRRHLTALLRVSRRAYGEPDKPEDDQE